MAQMRVLKKRILVLIAMPLAMVTYSADAPIPLWTNSAPDALGTSSNDIPTMTAYLATVTNTTRTAIVICPSGGYGSLDLSDGRNYAMWLNQYGVTCFVLKYRLGTHGYHYPAMLNDLTRAVRLVRTQVNKLNLNSHHVGVMGVSAGGHLAAALMTHFDMGDPNATDPVERQSSRPDFAVLCYPVITMMDEFGNQVSRDNLLGSNAPTRLKRLTSEELNVTVETPPCFLWSSIADDAVPMENTMMFAEALRKSRIRFELHVYERGDHRAGLTDDMLSTNAHLGTVELHFWLKEHKWAN
jgi:acetyl esterase/lipase